MTFDFYPVPRIQFGVGQFDRLPEGLRPLGRRVLVVHSADALVERVTDALKPDRFHVAFFRQRGEPTTEHVERALGIAKQERVGCLLALGGGSAIDCAKAAAGLLTNEGEPLDYMEVVGRGKKITAPSAPWIAIPTTAGTGAEATRNAVVALSPSSSSSSTPFKASIRSEHLLPRGILIDPQLHVAVPPPVTARSGMDALCQCIESYTSTNASPMTDPLALQGISLAARSLKRCCENGNDIAAREDMALAALLSGICLTNAGLGAVHGFAAPLGAHFPIPHGVICAALLPHVMQANIAALQSQYPGHSTLRRYAMIGRTLAGIPDLTDADALTVAVQFTRRLNEDLHIPSLSSFHFDASEIPPMVQLAKTASSMRYNPVPLPDPILAGILKDAL
jgi:alcohol dehydrogenase class IV